MCVIWEVYWKWIKEHATAVLTGVFVVFLIVSPHIRAWHIVGTANFEGVHPAFSDDEVYYQARIKEAVEGKWWVGNPYLKEHIHDPFVMPPVAEGLIAGVTRLTNTSVPFVTSVSDVVFPFIDFLLLYTLFLILTQKNKRVSLFYTVSFFCFFLATFGRPISPQFNALFLFLGLISITKIYFSEGTQNKKRNVIAGMITGITCFISPYYFTTLLVLYFILIGARTVYEKSAVAIQKNIPWFLMSFIPFAALFAFFQLRAAEGSYYGEAVLRFGLMHTHIPGSFTNIVLGILTLGVLVFALKTISLHAYLYCSSLLVSIFVLNWQNVITGKSLQFSSHYSFTTILSVLMVFSMIHTALLVPTNAHLSKWRKTAIILSIVTVFSLIAYHQKGEFMNIARMPYSEKELIHEQEKMEVFNWLNEHTPEDSVVYALGGNYDFLIPIYTKNAVYYNFYATLYSVSNEETEERWLIQNLFGSGMSTSTLLEKQRDYWGNRFIDSHQSAQNRKKILAIVSREVYEPSEMIDNKYIDEMYARWNYVKQKPFNKALSQYEVDYIILSKEYVHWHEAEKKLKDLKEVTLIATINGDQIYEFHETF